MGSKEEEEAELRVPLFSTTLSPLLLQSPDHSGTSYYSPASVPFVWEEAPGKPKSCTTLCIIPPPQPTHKCLELPPRLLSTHTPTDNKGSSRFKFHSSSFRIGRDCYGSFGSSPPDKLQQQQQHHVGVLVVSKRGNSEKGLFGSWKREVSKREGYIFPSSTDCSRDGDHQQQESSSITRVGSFTSLSPPPTSQFWGSVYKGLKHGFSRNSNKKTTKLDS